MTTATQPKVEWGFYAITPRIVRTQYKDLSHAEKWLYVCLKDLCGEKGMCYRTLRSLSEETNISIASLSSMIPSLQKAGLIHAEKKKRSNSGKEVWHISIVDIWQANRDYCSKNEQSNEFVQKMNNDVQNLNDVTGLCSENERVCSDFPYRRITIEEETITEERTIEEERENVATATARSQSSPSSQETQDDETVKREAVKPSQKDTTHGTSVHPASSGSALGNARAASGSRTKRQDTNKVGTPPAPDKSRINATPPAPHAKPVEPHADMAWGTRKCLQWFDYWRGGILIAKYKLQQAASCAKGLAEQFDEATVIEIRDRMAQDTFWMERGGPDVCDVANNIHKEINKKSAKATGKSESNGKVISSFGTPGYNATFADEFYPSEKEKKAYYAAQAAQQGVTR